MVEAFVQDFRGVFCRKVKDGALPDNGKFQ